MLRILCGRSCAIAEHYCHRHPRPSSLRILQKVCACPCPRPCPRPRPHPRPHPRPLEAIRSHPQPRCVKILHRPRPFARTGPLRRQSPSSWADKQRQCDFPRGCGCSLYRWSGGGCRSPPPIPNLIVNEIEPCPTPHPTFPSQFNFKRSADVCTPKYDVQKSVKQNSRYVLQSKFVPQGTEDKAALGRAAIAAQDLCLKSCKGRLDSHQHPTKPKLLLELYAE